MLHNCSRRLRPVATFCELSMTSNFGCFASLCFASSLNAPLVAVVINTQSCSTSQYVRSCGISNSQYLIRIELLSTFIDVRVSSQDRNACSYHARYQKSTSHLMFYLVNRHRITETVFANKLISRNRNQLYYQKLISKVT